MSRKYKKQATKPTPCIPQGGILVEQLACGEYTLTMPSLRSRTVQASELLSALQEELTRLAQPSSPPPPRPYIPTQYRIVKTPEGTYGGKIHKFDERGNDAPTLEDLGLL